MVEREQPHRHIGVLKDVSDVVWLCREYLLGVHDCTQVVEIYLSCQAT